MPLDSHKVRARQLQVLLLAQRSQHPALVGLALVLASGLHSQPHQQLVLEPTSPRALVKHKQQLHQHLLLGLGLEVHSLIHPNASSSCCSASLGPPIAKMQSCCHIVKLFMHAAARCFVAGMYRAVCIVLACLHVVRKF